MKTFWKPITAVVVFLVMQVLGGVFILFGTSILQLTQANAIALSLIISGALTVGILLLLRIIHLRTFSPKKIKWALVPTALAAAILGIFSMDLLSEQLNLPDMMKDEFGDMAKSFWGIVAIAIIGPIVEELVFREGIIRPLVHRHVHRWLAVLISASAFALIHINPAQIPFAFVMGLILGIIYVKMGNILLTSLIHILNNSLAVVEINVLGEHIDEFSYCEVLGGPVITWLYIVISAALCVIFLIQFWNKYHRR